MESDENGRKENKGEIKPASFGEGETKGGNRGGEGEDEVVLPGDALAYDGKNKESGIDR